MPSSLPPFSLWQMIFDNVHSIRNDRRVSRLARRSAGCQSGDTELGPSENIGTARLLVSGQVLSYQFLQHLLRRWRSPNFHFLG
jgi:hypothetical protein